MDVSASSRITALATQETRAQNAPENLPLIRATATVNRAKTFGEDRELVFSVEPETRQPIVKLIDSESKSVIRQIPPKEVLEVAKTLDKFFERKSDRSER